MQLMRQQSGFTLIELMISMTIGLIVIAAATTIVVTNMGAQRDSADMISLNQDMRAIANLMTRDIRRAGFLTSEPEDNGALLLANPFFDDSTVGATTDISVLDSGNCLLFSYNRDDDNPPVIDANERLGFRLSGGALQMRTEGTTNEACDTEAEWETISGPRLTFAEITFTPSVQALNVTSMQTDSDNDGVADGDDDGNGLCDATEACQTCVSGESCLYVRSISYTLIGHLNSDSNIEMSLSEVVRIRNDKFVEAL